MKFKDLDYSTATKFYDAATERVFKFILLLNTGGLVTCITFLNNPNGKINLITPATLFLAGLISSAVAIVLEYLGDLINLLQVKAHEKQGTKPPVTKLDYVIGAVLIGSGTVALILGFSGVIITFCKAKTLFLNHI